MNNYEVYNTPMPPVDNCINPEIFARISGFEWTSVDVETPESLPGTAAMEDYVENELPEIFPCTCQATNGKKCKADCPLRRNHCECDCECSCEGEQCDNQRLQEGFMAGVKLTCLGAPGEVVAARQIIKPGDLVGQYSGARYLRVNNPHGESSEFSVELLANPPLDIDATDQGNIFRYMLTSCNPNCRKEIWRIGNTLCIGIVAIKRIPPGETLSWDSSVNPCWCQDPEYCSDGIPETVRRANDARVHRRYPRKEKPSESITKKTEQRKKSKPKKQTCNDKFFGPDGEVLPNIEESDPVAQYPIDWASLVLSHRGQSPLPGPSSGAVQSSRPFSPLLRSGPATIPCTPLPITSPETRTCTPSPVASPETRTCTPSPTTSPAGRPQTPVDTHVSTQTSTRPQAEPNSCTDLVPFVPFEQSCSRQPSPQQLAMDLTTLMQTLLSLPSVLPTNQQFTQRPVRNLSPDISDMPRTTQQQKRKRSRSAEPPSSDDMPEEPSYEGDPKLKMRPVVRLTRCDNLLPQRTQVPTTPETRPRTPPAAPKKGAPSSRIGSRDKRKRGPDDAPEDECPPVRTTRAMAKTTKAPVAKTIADIASGLRSSRIPDPFISTRPTRTTSAPPAKTGPLLPKKPATKPGPQAKANTRPRQVPAPSMPGSSRDAVIPGQASKASKRRQVEAVLKQAKIDKHPKTANPDAKLPACRPTNETWDCPFCPNKYSGRSFSNFRKHVEAHLKVNDFPCKVKGCKTICNNQNDLNKHARMHLSDDERPWFHCGTCDKRYKYSSDVNAHMKRSKGACPIDVPWIRVDPGNVMRGPLRFRQNPEENVEEEPDDEEPEEPEEPEDEEPEEPEDEEPEEPENEDVVEEDDDVEDEEYFDDA